MNAKPNNKFDYDITHMDKQETQWIKNMDNSNSFEIKDCSTEPSSASPMKFKLDDIEDLMDEDIFVIDDDFLLFDDNSVMNMEILENGTFTIDQDLNQVEVER